MNPGASATLAMGVGYVLGRQHKLRTALLVGAASAAGRLSKGPVSKAMGSGDGGGEQGGAMGGGLASGVVSKLGDAGKTAARSVMTKSADRLSDRLNATATALRGGDGSRSEEGDDQ